MSSDLFRHLEHVLHFHVRHFHVRQFRIICPSLQVVKTAASQCRCNRSVSHCVSGALGYDASAVMCIRLSYIVRQMKTDDDVLATLPPRYGRRPSAVPLIHVCLTRLRCECTNKLASSIKRLAFNLLSCRSLLCLCLPAFAFQTNLVTKDFHLKRTTLMRKKDVKRFETFPGTDPEKTERGPGGQNTWQ